MVRHSVAEYSHRGISDSSACTVFAGRSSVSGYQTADGINADFSDRTLGLGNACRVIQAGRFTFGALAQAEYYGSWVNASYPDGFGKVVEHRDGDRDPLATVGPEIDYQAAPRLPMSPYSHDQERTSARI